MSILDGLQKTTEQIAYEKILTYTKNLSQGEKNRCKAAYIDLWGSIENPKSIEQCQAILDLFGSDAYEVFQYHSKWQQFIASIDNTYEPLIPPYDYTINEDGTVILSIKEE